MSPPRTLLNKLAAYQTDTVVAELVQSVPTLLLVGISGAGKDTVKRALLERGGYHHIVSHTTRAPRLNHGEMEQDGADYHFIDYQTAEHMLDNHGYVEAKQYGQNIYGTSVGEFKLAYDEHKIAITDLEVQGVDEYMDLAPHSVRPVFLLPPSYDTWQWRVEQRYGQSHQDHLEDIRHRSQTAVRELEHLLQTDYFFAVVNDDLEACVRGIDTIAKTGKGDPNERRRAFEIAREIITKLQHALTASI